MANEIDLYQDLEEIEEYIAKAKHDKNIVALRVWKNAYKMKVKEIKTLYPDLAL